MVAELVRLTFGGHSQVPPRVIIPSTPFESTPFPHRPLMMAEAGIAFSVGSSIVEYLTSPSAGVPARSSSFWAVSSSVLAWPKNSAVVHTSGLPSFSAIAEKVRLDSVFHARSAVQ